MSWDYFLVPQPSGSLFSPEMVSAMHTYWAEWPTYRRSDGVYVLALSAAERDDVVAKGLQDVPQWLRDLVKIAPERVTFGVMGDEEQCRVLFRFMKWVSERVPCELRDESDSPVDLDYWLAVHTGAFKRGPRS